MIQLSVLALDFLCEVSISVVVGSSSLSSYFRYLLLLSWRRFCFVSLLLSFGSNPSIPFIHSFSILSSSSSTLNHHHINNSIKKGAWRTAQQQKEPHIRRSMLYIPDFDINNNNNNNNNDDNKSITKIDNNKNTTTNYYVNGIIILPPIETKNIIQQQEQSITSSNNSLVSPTGSLGDIMDGLITKSSSVVDPSSTTSSSLSSSSSSEQSSLEYKYGINNPFDRMALTANGNLQRLISSYYDSPVEVYVEYCNVRPSSSSSTTDSKTWDRKVKLSVLGHVFCTATSVITIHDIYCQQLVETNQIGLGQLFRYLDILPQFTLHNAGKIMIHDNDHNDIESNSSIDCNGDNTNDNDNNGGGGFWRKYTLKCKELTCNIYEEFSYGLWNINKINKKQKVNKNR